MERLWPTQQHCALSETGSAPSEGPRSRSRRGRVCTQQPGSLQHGLGHTVGLSHVPAWAAADAKGKPSPGTSLPLREASILDSLLWELGMGNPNPTFLRGALN